MSFNSSNIVLVSWAGVNNDLSKRLEMTKSTKHKTCLVDESIMEILYDSKSPYKNNIKNIFLLYGPSVDDNKKVLSIEKEIKKQNSSIKIDKILCKIVDSTDYKTIFELFKTHISEIRNHFPIQQLVFNISAGTSEIKTALILLAETKIIPQPVELIQILNPEKRKGKKVFQNVNLGIETYNQVYTKVRQKNIPRQSDVDWNPKNFKSPLLIDLYNKAASFAELSAPILIIGESGTGKANLAAWIRLKSRYRESKNDDKWPNIQCGEYSEDDLRKQIIGYRKDAFIGAIRNFEGILSAADKDTVFLDEIEKLPIDVQKYLTRAIDEKKFWPIGSKYPVEVNFRLVVATSLDRKEIEKHLDRQFLDLISICQLRTPSLSELKEDIDWLWHRVLMKSMFSNMQWADCNFLFDYGNDPRILHFLKSEPLNGNLHDLFKMALILITILQEKDPKKEKDAIIDEAISRYQTMNQSSALNEYNPAGDSLVPFDKRVKPSEMQLGAKHCLKNRVRNLEIQSVYEALKAADNNQDKAAKLLGIRNLTMRMQKLKLKPKRHRKNTQSNKKTKKA